MKQAQWRSQPKNLGGQKLLGGEKMFDIKRITLFCLEKRLSNHKHYIFQKFWGGMAPLPPSWLRLLTINNQSVQQSFFCIN